MKDLSSQEQARIAAQTRIPTPIVSEPLLAGSEWEESKDEKQVKELLLGTAVNGLSEEYWDCDPQLR
jgi:hypothetical protein